MMGGSFRVMLPCGLSFSCPRGQYVHSSGSTSGDLRAPHIPGLTTSLDASSLPPNFEGHWRKFRDLCILRETAAVHAELQGRVVAGPGLGQRGTLEEGADAAEEDSWIPGTTMSSQETGKGMASATSSRTITGSTPTAGSEPSDTRAQPPSRVITPPFAVMLLLFCLPPVARYNSTVQSVVRSSKLRPAHGGAQAAHSSGANERISAGA